jgi:hypothetical protein
VKQAISIGLIITFLLPSINRVWILIDFKMHQSYIAEVLCINKDKPEEGCGGKCYLSNQLKKQEEKEHQQLPLNSTEKNEVLFVDNFAVKMDVYNTLKWNQKKWRKYRDFYSSEFLDQIFHPPQFS